MPLDVRLTFRYISLPFLAKQHRQKIKLITQGLHNKTLNITKIIKAKCFQIDRLRDILTKHRNTQLFCFCFFSALST